MTEETTIEQKINSMPINLTLSVEQVNIVLAGLGKLPFELVNQLMTFIHTQAEPQYTSHKAELMREESEELTVVTSGESSVQ